MNDSLENLLGKATSEERALLVSYAHYNGLSAAQDERLAILMEECSEVIKAAAKIQRHGYDSVNPDDEEAGDNRHRLATEIGHLQSIVNRMARQLDYSVYESRSARDAKSNESGKWLRHQA